MSNRTSPSLSSLFSVFNPITFSPSCSFSTFVLPTSTGTVLIYGSPSIYCTTSLGFIPLNLSIVFTSICASIILCPNRFFAFSSYCASLSVADIDFLISLSTDTLLSATMKISYFVTFIIAHAISL